jgi:alpha-L-rhamnosidase/Glycosyl hydrolases family 2, sugar binding domain
MAAGGMATGTDLARQFDDPPRQAQPWVYWVWTGDTTTEAITRDLQEMKAKGIVGCILYDVQSDPGHNWWDKTIIRDGKDYRAVPTDDFPHPYVTPIPAGELPSWSSHWRELVCFSAGQAARLGLDLVVSDGLASTSGRISEEYGEQKLVWKETAVRGPQIYDETLPEPKMAPPRANFPHPEWKNYHRDVAVLAVPDQDGFSPDQVINLTAKMDINGRLHWKVPEGNWKILRFIQVPTGTFNAWGYYNDCMSTEAMAQTWAVTMAPLLKQMTPEQRRGLKGIEDDSWEAGKTLWTKRFPEEFKKRRGYDLIPYLPILADYYMSDAETRMRVQRDYALTISDLISDNHYACLNELARDNGLTFYAEAAGPNYDQADLLKTSSKVGGAMAEFWMPSAHRATMDKRFLVRNVANADHIYGRPITMCEAFTSLGPEWEEAPFDMKSVADQAFCDGLNRICFHTFSQSPSLTAKPGYVYCAGTHYDPGMTWWDETPAFNAYLARCSAMLQAGRFVADVAFYQGDNIGHGEQRKTIWPTLGEGYDHDNCNSEVLLTRMSARDGRIVLPDGMNYRVLVLPDQCSMPLKDLRKVASLLDAGATVVGWPPSSMSGMPVHRGDEKEFDALAARLRARFDGTNANQKQIGKGHLIWGKTVRQVLQDQGIAPDFEATGVSEEGTIDWIHRQPGEAEIYYVASRWAHPEKIVAAFRVTGRQPELWDAVTGERRDAKAFRQKDGRTFVPLEFGPCGSTFVVFRRTLPPDANGTAASNYPVIRPMLTISGPWTVNFDPKWGGPELVVFDQLLDWTNSQDPGIKYYSGAAVYHKQFNLSGTSSNDRLLLDLGEVNNVASVRLNGKELGVIWNRPATIDISSTARNGENDLEITVINLWPNRLIGDESLPKDKRLTETNIHKFGPASPLLPSGLIGPVRLLAVEALP